MDKDHSLPVSGRLRIFYLFSALIALLMTFSSAAGLLYSSEFYIGEKLSTAFIPTDLVNLVLGLPAFLISILLSKQGKLIGYLVWPGMLMYVLYIYIPYILLVPFSFLFPVYLLMVTLSLWILIGLLASYKPDPIKDQLLHSIPEKASGGILMGLASIIVLRQSAQIVMALEGSIAYDFHEAVLWIADFAIAAPALLLTGILLWRKKPLGYLAAPGLFFIYGILSLGLIPYFIFEAQPADIPLDITGMVVVIFMAALCLVPFSFFIRKTYF